MTLKTFFLIAILLLVLFFVISHAFFFIKLSTGIGALAVLILLLFLRGKLK
jgi:hypothetical protein